MQTLWWILFVLTAPALVYSVVTAARRARAGEPTPTWAAGDISGGVGILLLIGAYPVGIDTRVGLTMIIASGVLSIASIMVWVKAVRRERALTP